MAALVLSGCAAGGNGAMVTLEFQYPSHYYDGYDTRHEIRSRDNRAFAVFDGPYRDALKNVLNIDPHWSGFLGASRIRRLATEVAVTGRDGAARVRLPKGRYVVCLIGPFPNEGTLYSCDEFELLTDTRIRSFW